MKLKPSDNWRWYFDNEYDRMMLDLSNTMLFRSRFASNLLTSDAFEQSIFTLEDASLFYLFDENCTCLGLSGEHHAELVLNAVIAQRYLKPLLPKSWHFTQQNHDLHPKLGELVAVNVSESGFDALLLVVEAGDNASVCVLAQPQLQLMGRNMLLGEAIKVMHDRMIPVHITQGASQNYFYARVS